MTAELADARPGSVGPQLSCGLEIQPSGRPSHLIRCIALDDWHEAATADIRYAAETAAASSALTIGLATRQPPRRLRPILDAATVTLVGRRVDTGAVTMVQVADPEESLELLSKAAARSPQACVALGHLLRQTPRLTTVSGLAAEAAVYSMLLGGSEFTAWRSSFSAPSRPRPAQRELVQVRRDGTRLQVVLDHPERRNAFSFRMREEFYAALELAVWDRTITSVDISGAGPAFCSGGDLAEFGTATDLVAAYLVRLERAPWRLIDQLRERVTVRTHGAVVGAAIEMAAFAGRVVATPDAYFLLPEVTMGLVPGAGGTVSVPRRIGRWRAAWMMLCGQRIDAHTARRWGLVDELEPR